MSYFNAAAFPFPMHSITIWQKGRILQDECFGMFCKDEPHRMFSITKVFTALAIGALISENRLSFDDPVIQYFPEYTPADPHPYLAAMTLKDMLGMRTCYASTTYKINMKTNWVESFFTTTPDHRPGMIFKYDTSSAHTMAALVKKISGKGILDYLREVYLDALGFSAEAHVITDPFGSEIGGSGLVCTTQDLLKVARLLLALYNDTLDRDFPDICGCADSIYDRSFWKRYAAFIKDAMSYHTSNLHDGKTLDEKMGYGYQFWMVRDGGIMMYGMGGQYVLIYPKQELIFVTTADTQMMGGGTQYILNEIHRVALELGVEPDPAPVNLGATLPQTTPHPALRATFPSRGRQEKGTAASLQKTETGSSAQEPEIAIAVNPALFGSWKLQPNKSGFTALELNENELVLTSEEYRFVFPYGLDTPTKTRDQKYRQTIYTQGFPQKDGSLYLYAQILDEYVGNMHFVLNVKDSRPTLYIRKIEETFFGEFNGFFEGV